MERHRMARRLMGHPHTGHLNIQVLLTVPRLTARQSTQARHTARLRTGRRSTLRRHMAHHQAEQEGLQVVELGLAIFGASSKTSLSKSQGQIIS